MENTISLSAPSGSPVGFTAVAGEREVVFSWSPPPVTERNGVTPSPAPLLPPPSPSPPPQDLSQWLASLLTPATPVLWWPATLRALDLLHPPHLPHCKTVSLSNDFFFHHTQFSDLFFQLRLSGLLSTCPEELVSHPSYNRYV